VLADKDINFEDAEIANRNPVRLVEATMLSPDAERSCAPEDERDEISDAEAYGICSQPGVDPRDVLPHFLNPAYSREDDDGQIITPFVFCSCEKEGERDKNALLATLYVEDQDENRRRDPKDKIYAALLLDLPQREPHPDNYLDYQRYVDPSRELELSGTPYSPEKRRDPQLRELVLGISVDGNDQTGGIDLCNGGSRVLEPGFHSLTVMVTDRPWFRPADGGIGSEHAGVPDLAIGATFDSITYVFYCGSATEEDDPNKCAEQCAVPAPEGQ
jgi:hypothetical protein